MAALLLALRALEKRRRARLDAFVEAALAPRLLLGYDARVRRPLFWLTAAGFALLLLAMAQPHWGKSWRSIERGSRDIMVLLDTSASMDAKDPLPNRMVRARQEIEAMMDRCPADRFGLIVFAGEAVLQSPLTLDHAYFRSVLNAIDTGIISAMGTNIAAAMEEAQRVFEDDIAQTGESGRHARAVLLISDGEQVSGDAVEAAKELGQYAGIYVIGIGNPEGVEVEFPAALLREYRRVPAEYRTHLSKLDEKMLAKIAVDSGGLYVRSKATNEDVDRIHEEFEALAARGVSDELRFTRVNRYRWPLAGAAACFAAEGAWLVLMPWLRRRRMGKFPPANEECAHA